MATNDVSPIELDKIQRRAAIRRELKAEFNRKMYNPYRQVYRIEMHDPAIERHMAARASRLEHVKPNWRTFLIYYSIIIIPTYVISSLVAAQKREEERMYRGGLIPYEDQPNKPIRIPFNGWEML